MVQKFVEGMNTYPKIVYKNCFPVLTIYVLKKPWVIDVYRIYLCALD
jgi:hypothetical protein